MAGIVRTSIKDRVLVVEIDNPPVNALGQAVREGLIAAFSELGETDAADACILVGRGRTFPAGADITEFSAEPRAPHLPDVCAAIRASTKPVVACLHGTVLGGGFEIALAAQGRIAASGTRLGFPEINLGIMPGAGGTQLLARLVGAERALDMMLSGKPLIVETGQTHGLVDGIVEGDLVSAGVTFAHGLLDAPRLPLAQSRTQFQDAMAYQNAISLARKTHADHPTQAAAKIIDCVEAAPLLPSSAGLALERELFLELRESAEAEALRHAFLATRLAAKPARPLPDATPVGSVGVVGGGLMGAAIAVSSLDAGLPVLLLERDAEAAALARARVEGIYGRAVKRGVLEAAARNARLARLELASHVDELRDCDLIIEAVSEEASTKEDILDALAQVAKPEAIIATNTSYLDLEELAGASRRPDRFLGLHFFAPAHVQPVIELAIGVDTSPETEARARGVIRALGKTCVQSKGTPGYIGNRILTAYRAAAELLVAQGAAPYAVDEAMVAFGFKMGPFESLDLSGLDVSARFRAAFAAARMDRPFPMTARLLEVGRLGQKTGAGVYRYDDPGLPRAGRPDPDVLSLIDALRGEVGAVPRGIPAGEITETCLLAMLNEGARLLEEGVALRASDIDVLLLAGFGFPRHKGGPMKYAQMQGLLAALKRLEELAADESFWAPFPALREAVKNGNRFPSNAGG